MQGLRFFPPLTVFIGSGSCSPLTLVSSSEAICTLQAGAGFDQQVVVSANGQFSFPVVALSYSAPVIQSITSTACSTTGSQTSLNLCARNPAGAILTISGQFFGLSGATVLVGSINCNAVHDTQRPDSLVRCVLPAGNRLSVPVVLFQLGGEGSNRGSVSYAQCQPGSYENGTLCINCLKGSLGCACSLTSVACRLLQQRSRTAVVFEM